MIEGFAPSGAWRADVIADFARSELFDRTFQEGMDLVEETEPEDANPVLSQFGRLQAAFGA